MALQRVRPFVLSFCLLIAACSSGSGDTGGSDASSSSFSSEAPMTRNVSYIGVVDAAEATIYQQGTHTLTLADDRVIMLEANDAALDLDSYIGQNVEVRGSAQPTVEGGGTIMSVEQVTVIGGSSASISSVSTSASSSTFCGGIAGFPCPAGFTCVDDPSDSCDPMNGGADCSGTCVPASSSSVSSISSVASSVSSATSSVWSSSLSQNSVSSAGSSLPPTAREEDIVAMSKQNYADAGQWTQQYCTGHIGFCVPAHRNWYYKSFGTTTSNLWHVEFGMKELNVLDDGLISLNVLPGSSADAGGLSGNVQARGTMAVGYLDWEENRHFEISADARLQPAVQYMLSHITAYDAAQ